MTFVANTFPASSDGINHIIAKAYLAMNILADREEWAQTSPDLWFSRGQI
jgi:hypothetical protein